MKHHLKRDIGENSFTYVEFASLLWQIEAMLNSRPLVTVRSEIDGEDILTPGHFLVGRPLIGAPEHSGLSMGIGLSFELKTDGLIIL